jgi:SAM-dependent methyltransferase
VTADSDTGQAALLHHGGPAGRWGNLGFWPESTAPAISYAEACSALARHVGEAARLLRQAAVLDLACGAGEELPLWVEAFGVGSVQAVELDADSVRHARARVQVAGLADRIQVHAGPALPLAAELRGPFDAILCVDAAYHLGPREALFDMARHRLQAGGRIAFTDLVLDDSRFGANLLLRGAARLCGLRADDLISTDLYRHRLGAAGFADIRIERLDEPVLGGFVRFVHAQRRRLGGLARGAGWRRVAITAALIPPCRAAGLGYALISARKAGAAGDPRDA